MNVTMNKDRLTLLGSAGLGAGLGAGLMYLLDPQGGRRRRALARDKAVHLAKTSGTAVGKKSRHLGNRTKGLIAEAGSKLRRHEQADPLALHESTDNGSSLHEHEKGGLGSTLRRSLAPASRLAAGACGCGMTYAGLKRRDRLGAALGAVGLGLLAGGLGGSRVTGLVRRGKENGNGSGLADLHSEPAQSGELASHGDSLHHNNLLAHDQHAGGSSSLQEDPFQPL